jgi:DHA1 family multidrug resistance protein B-like MFS transporter
MIFPFMTIYLTKNLGLATAGGVMIGATISAIFGTLLGGGLADKVGRRPVMLGAEVARIFIFLGFVVSSSTMYYSPGLLAFFYVFRNFFNGLYGPASEAMLLDLSTPEQRSHMYQIIYWVNNFSLAIGVFIGTYFFETHIGMLFFVLFIVSIFTTFATYKYISESMKHKESDIRPTMLNNYKIVLKDKLFIIYFVASVLIMSLDTNITKFTSIVMTSKTYNLFSALIDGQKFFGLLLTENTILVIILSFIMSLFVLNDKKHNVLFFLSLFIYIVCFGLLTILDDGYFLIFFMGLGTFGEVIFNPIFQTYLGDIAVERYRSSYIGFYKLAYRLSTLLSSGLILLLQYTSTIFVTIIALLLSSLGYIITWYVVSAIKNKKIY